MRVASADTSETAVSSRVSHSKFVRVASADTSETAVPLRCSHRKFVRCASAETSETAVELSHSHRKFVRVASVKTSETSVCRRSSCHKFVRDASADTSDIALLLTCSTLLVFSPPKSTTIKLTACSSPVRSFIPRSRWAPSATRLRMECVVTGSPEDILSDSRTAAAKFGSGIETTLAGGSREATSIGNLSLPTMSPSIPII